MTFFLIKAADEAFAGNLSAAMSTLTSGAPPAVKTVEDDLGDALAAFLKVFAADEAKTLLTAATTAVTSGISAGEASALAGTVANAAVAAPAAQPGLAAAGAATLAAL